MKPARSPKQDGQLNVREKQFCVEYLKDLNGLQAAIRAGYAKSNGTVQSTRLLARPSIQKYLSEQFAARTKAAEVDIEFVLRELIQIANCDIGEAFNPNGTLKGIHDIPTPVRKCIASFDNEELFEMVESTSGKGKRIREWTGTLRKVKFWPKDRGLEMLGKYLAMFVERNRFENKNGEPLPAVQVNVINVKPGEALPKAEGLRASTTPA